MSETEVERCLAAAQDEMTTGRNIPVIVPSNDEYLDEMRRELYRKEREKFIVWLYTQGRNPHKGEGYAGYTLWETNHRTARFERFVWDRHDGYVYPPTPEDADAWNEQLKMRDVKSATKGKEQEAVMRYFDWRHRERAEDKWEPGEEQRFSSTGSDSDDTPDYLDIDERKKIREAAVDYCGDWKRVSLVWSSLDCGFRPIEIHRAKDYWFKPEQKKVIIPADESSKEGDNKENRTLNDQAAHAIEQWLTERSGKARYDDTDTMWLTQKGNPYGERSLSRLIKTLADHAGIETRGRKMTWYAIRHSVGAYLTAARDLKATKKQLGHSDLESTLRYDKIVGEDIREALDKMG